MKKKLIGLIVCTLLIIAPVLSTTGTLNNNSLVETSAGYNDLVSYIIGEGGCSSGNWSELAKLIASDGEYKGYFGKSVFISGDYTIIGASGTDENQGSAYIFKKTGTTWAEEQKLIASDGTPGDYCGSSVSISGDYAIVGAPNDCNINGKDAGSAYIFKKTGTTWAEEQKLIASDGAHYDYFGSAVSIIGDYAFVNVWTMDYYGAVYIFKRNGSTWVEYQKLFPSDVEEGDCFGWSFSFCGDYAIVGAPNDDNVYGTNAGAAYIFKKIGTTWVEEQKIMVSDARGAFGYSVSMSGDYAIIGALHHVYTDVGAAHIFKKTGTTWTREQKLNASDGEIEDWFGYRVSISDSYGGYAIVSAYAADNSTGSVYLFKNTGTTWVEEQKLIASDGESKDYFGCSVSISGLYVVIGASGDDNSNGWGAGSAYVFKRLSAPDLVCVGDIKWTDVKPNSVVMGEFTVENIGDPGSELFWEIESYPDWGNWTFSPDKGFALTPEEGPVIVNVEVVAPDEKNSEFTGSIKIVNTEDGNDYDKIYVSLATPKNRAFNINFNLLEGIFKRFSHKLPIIQ